MSVICLPCCELRIIVTSNLKISESIRFLGWACEYIRRTSGASTELSGTRSPSWAVGGSTWRPTRDECTQGRTSRDYSWPVSYHSWYYDLVNKTVLSSVRLMSCVHKTLQYLVWSSYFLFFILFYFLSFFPFFFSSCLSSYVGNPWKYTVFVVWLWLGKLSSINHLLAPVLFHLCLCLCSCTIQSFV